VSSLGKIIIRWCFKLLFLYRRLMLLIAQHAQHSMCAVPYSMAQGGVNLLRYSAMG
jgi:hypothetical protein